MAMIVQHNLNAINANNKLGVNVLGTKKSTEKLSSGFRINRAADDAAGLAISEKMRAQLKGLNSAIRNANDGISLIQTAEGALDETHAMLKRLEELAVLAGNDTYGPEEREYMQQEINDIKSEIDRIAKATDFNGIKLLDGSLSGKDASVSNAGPRYAVYLSSFASPTADGNHNLKAATDQNLSLDGAVITSDIAGVSVSLADGATIGGENAKWDLLGKTLTLNLVKGQTYNQTQINELIKNAVQAKAEGVIQTNSPANVTFTLKSSPLAFNGAETFTTVSGVQASSAYEANNLSPFLISTTSSTDRYADSIQFISNTYGVDVRKITILTDAENGKEKIERTSTTDNEAQGVKDGEFTLHLSTGKEYTAQDIEKLLAKEGINYTVNLTTAGNTAKPSGDTVFYASTKVLTGGLQLEMADGAGVGADKKLGAGDGLTFQIGTDNAVEQRVTLNVNAMDSTSIGISTFDVTTAASARNALDNVKGSITTVSAQRARLGAMQNRLEHTVNSLTVTSENLTAAEAQIRDTDMATEMVEFTKFNILQQAAQAMLAQANQAPQAILQLLR